MTCVSKKEGGETPSASAISLIKYYFFSSSFPSLRINVQIYRHVNLYVVDFGACAHYAPFHSSSIGHPQTSKVSKLGDIGEITCDSL